MLRQNTPHRWHKTQSSTSTETTNCKSTTKLTCKSATNPACKQPNTTTRPNCQTKLQPLSYSLLNNSTMVQSSTRKYTKKIKFPKKSLTLAFLQWKLIIYNYTKCQKKVMFTHSLQKKSFKSLTTTEYVVSFVPMIPNMSHPPRYGVS